VKVLRPGFEEVILVTPHPVPTVDDVRRIAAIDDPVIRNLQITHCYHELSAVLAARTGGSANWCTFATWASKQAGQTIRKEDLARLLENRLRRSQAALQSTHQAEASASMMRETDPEPSEAALLEARNYTTAIDRASAAVARGNKKVFEEIGYEFARFYATCLLDEEDGPVDGEAVSRFCGELHSGEPPQGQGYLRQAFTHYAQALATADPKVRAELILLANVEIGFHEQTRLQPEIAESVDAGFINSTRLARQLLVALFPASSWLTVAYLHLRRVLGRPTTLDLAVRALLATIQRQLRHTVTELMMTITLPSGVQLRLGDDLQSAFPETLRDIANPELRALLAGIDPTPNSPLASGAADWADLADRLHFIVDLFRCYQENADLLAAPFTPEQVAAFKAGKRPTGWL
jgi:hypothetical protein